MNPLSAIYGAFVFLRNALYDTGLLSGRLRQPVVSVGNLSSGGTGKTPFVILLGGHLKERGISFDVLSRGYGRETRGAMVVDPAGSASRFGDEPLLIARRLGVPVVVGESRFDAGQLAEHKFRVQLHLLDDGFQHRALYRDFDIVLVTPADLKDRLFPLGRLREPLASLRRADAIVLVDEDAGADFPASGGKMLWHAQRGIRIGETPARQIAFCGIARPRSFFDALMANGLEPVAELCFPDHHRYREADITRLLSAQKQKNASGFVTTEKDAINLGVFVPRLQPLAIVPLRMQLQHAQDAVTSVLNAVTARRRRPA